MSLGRIVAPIVGLVVAGLLGACARAEVASSSVSQDGGSFKVVRRITFVNGVTGKCLLTVEGLCSIKADSAGKRIEVACRAGGGKCEKRYLGLSDNVTCVVEQVEASETDACRYKVACRPGALVPGIEMRAFSLSQSGS